VITRSGWRAVLLMLLYYFYELNPAIIVELIVLEPMKCELLLENLAIFEKGKMTKQRWFTQNAIKITDKSILDIYLDNTMMAKYDVIVENCNAIWYTKGDYYGAHFKLFLTAAQQSNLAPAALLLSNLSMQNNTCDGNLYSVRENGCVKPLSDYIR
jgi:hypothetical protein